ncbi:MAG: hypothetical protein ACFFCY_17460 [Promethearchaeota archaeon]
MYGLIILNKRFGVNVYIPGKGNIGENNEVAIKFKYQGSSTLFIFIKYVDLTSDKHEESATGGSFVIKYYETADYNTIMIAEFWYCRTGVYGYLWVDVLYVNYWFI